MLISQLADGPIFADRADAGARLARRLAEMSWSDPVVLGLARGGVPIAVRVADTLGAPLDVAVARKIGAPGHPEFGVGAVTADGRPRYDERTLAELGLTPDDLRRTANANAPRPGAGCSATGGVATQFRWPGGMSCWSTTGWPPGSPRGPHVFPTGLRLDQVRR
jgi:hypothetical protein